MTTGFAYLFHQGNWICEYYIFIGLLSSRYAMHTGIIDHINPTDHIRLANPTDHINPISLQRL
jgi:hypothetical protein